MQDIENLEDRPRLSRFHPVIYWTIIGLCLWLVAAMWSFDGSGYVGLVLTVVSLFIGVAIGIPALLWRISRHGAGGRRDRAKTPRFGDWLKRDFVDTSGHERGSDAAIEVLLPIAAVAIAMSAFSLVLHLSV